MDCLAVRSNVLWISTAGKMIIKVKQNISATGNASKFMKQLQLLRFGCYNIHFELSEMRFFFPVRSFRLSVPWCALGFYWKYFSFWKEYTKPSDIDVSCIYFLKHNQNECFIAFDDFDKRWKCSVLFLFYDWRHFISSTKCNCFFWVKQK